VSDLPFRIRARRPTGDPGPAALVRDADVLAGRLEDAAHFPGGHATELVIPASEAQVAGALVSCQSCLAIGAQSSLTGGATPMGETLLSTARFAGIEHIGPTQVRVGAGVTITELDRALEESGRAYPPAPTFFGATIGGTIATNAAGAATFKYGTTRDWIEAVTVVLPGGDVLDIVRGSVCAGVDGQFELDLAARRVRLTVPSYQMPDVPKLSAGYFARPSMDLIDLFIGCEGTLGVVTAATLRVLATRPLNCLALVFFEQRAAALAFVAHLRAVAATTWKTRERTGVDVSAIEHMDARCLSLIRADGLDRANGVRIPPEARMALLITLDMPSDADSQDRVLSRFAGMLAHAGALDHVEIAAAGDRARAAQLLAVREAVPAAVNAIVGRAKQTIDPRIDKTAADMIVPFERLGELLAFYDAEFSKRGLDAAVWGHISDGNVHPNVLPRSIEDVESGKAAILEFGREVLRMGGAPLAEHGVGRNVVKQTLLRMMYGDAGIEEMRRIKRAIDPEWKLAPGVLFGR